LVAGGARLDGWASGDGRRVERDRATGAVLLDDRPPDRDGTVPTARLGVRRDLSQTVYVRGATYAGFRPPTLNELHRPFRVGNDVTEANAALEPERLYGAELGTGGAFEGGGWALTAFWNRLDDPVTNVTIGFGPGTFPRAGFIPAGGVLRERRNAGEIDAVGVEGEVARDFASGLQLRAAFGFTDAEVDGGADAPQLTGKRPAQAPQWTVTAGAVWQATARLQAQAALRYESLRFEDDLNTRRLSPALGVDAQLSWSLTDTASLYVAADNLFDADVETGETADGVESFGPPRALRLGLTLRSPGG
ncbi:TonB-dependent receptor, partial [Caulobacter sp. 17J65-9]|uniref:TonB-dependent receptor domain-containing protein n=1 Tax=Caulobacter sp. 17J65-9 TaxID=2709382 RepID=UPI0013CCCAD3